MTNEKNKYKKSYSTTPEAVVAHGGKDVGLVIGKSGIQIQAPPRRYCWALEQGLNAQLYE